MSRPLRILAAALCAALVLSLPFLVSAPDLLPDVRDELTGGYEEIDFGAYDASGVENGDY